MKPSEQVYAGEYGPFSFLLIKNYNIPVTGKNGPETREGYRLNVSLDEGLVQTYTASINFVKGFGPEFELIDDALIANDKSQNQLPDQLPQVLIEVAFEHLCTDGHDFRLLIMRVYNRAITRGENQIRAKFQDLMKYPRG